MNSFKILISVLTHNRLNLLKRCIDGIDKQTYTNYDLLIINNGSDDGTSDYLSKLKINNLIVINQENTGSARGWHRAISYAKEYQYDYIWLMDDDGFPSEQALFFLVKNMTIQHACLSSIVVNENSKDQLLFPLPYLDKDKKPSLLSFFYSMKNVNQCLKNSKNNIVDFVHFFNGSLLSISKVSQISNVDILYQHHGVEIDFYYRLINVGKVSSLITAKHFHPDVNKRPLNCRWIFFYVKNSIIVNFKYLNYPFIRSLSVIIKCIFLIFKRNGIKFFFKQFLFSKNLIIFINSIYLGFKKDFELSKKINFND